MMPRQFKWIFFIVCSCIAGSSTGQLSYIDSVNLYRQEYVKKHGVVKAEEKKFMRFFPVNEQYRVVARVERIYEAPWFQMETSGSTRQVYRVYAVVHFSIRDSLQKLHVYQSQQLMNTEEWADHLFIPFTDAGSGIASYENGRYLDLHTNDLESGSYQLDFNKAYNPYCAYTSSGYNCPIPPLENRLTIYVSAGEMKFKNAH